MEEAPSLKTLLLAVLFAAGRPVALKELRALGHPEEAVLRALKALERDLEAGHLGVALERVAGGWRGRTLGSNSSSEAIELFNIYYNAEAANYLREGGEAQPPGWQVE